MSKVWLGARHGWGPPPSGRGWIDPAPHGLRKSWRGQAESLALLGGQGGGKASRRRVSEVGRSVGLGEGPEGEGAEAEHRASDPVIRGVAAS